MPKFCGKCGSPLDENSGLCPNCDPIRNDKPEANFQSNKNKIKNLKKELRAAKKVEKRQRRKENQKKHRVRTTVLRVLAIVLSFCIVIVSVGALSYFHIVDIPVVSDQIDKLVGPEKSDNFMCTGEKITEKKITDKNAAIDVAKDVSTALGYDTIADEYTVMNVNEFNGNIYYRLQENYEGIPVFGRSMVLISDSEGTSKGISTNVVDIDNGLNINIPDFNQQQFDQCVQTQMGAAVGIQSYHKSIYSLNEDVEPVVTYEVICTFENTNYRVFYDPVANAVLNVICLDYTEMVQCTGNGDGMTDNPQTFNAWKEENTYYLKDENRNICVYSGDRNVVSDAVKIQDPQNTLYCIRVPNRNDIVRNGFSKNERVIYDGNGHAHKYVYDSDKNTLSFDNTEIRLDDCDTDYALFDENGNELNLIESGENRFTNERAVAVMVNTQNTYDFYQSFFGRNGYDDNNTQMFCITDAAFYKEDLTTYGTNANSGGYDHHMLQFGFGEELNIDLIAHEYTHSVENSISGMVYQYESGAIMEGYSDIFGEIVEIVEDYYNDGVDNSVQNLNNNCDWKHGNRNIKHPILSENPSRYIDDILYIGHGNILELITDLDEYIKSDNGAVHDNSTIISHIAYLMVNSGSNNSKLSMEQLANLWYGTLFIMPSNCTFIRLRELIEQQASYMFVYGQISMQQMNHISECFNEANIQADLYSTEFLLSSFSEKDDKSFHVSITGTKGSHFWKSEVSEEFTLDKNSIQDKNANIGERESGSNFKYSKTINLSPGHYQIKVSDNSNNTEQVKAFEVKDPIAVYAERDLQRKINPIFGERINLPSQRMDFFFTDVNQQVAVQGQTNPMPSPNIVETTDIDVHNSDTERDTVSQQTDMDVKKTVASGDRNIVLVLDTSGSMQGVPMDKTKEAACEFVDRIAETNAAVAVVTYSDEAVLQSDFSNDPMYLKSIIDQIDARGDTNMEAGLKEAVQLFDSSASGKKIIVLMGDGIPNKGAEGDSLIGFVDEIKQSEKIIYTLGFFSSLKDNKSEAQSLMEALASDGCHYEIGSPDSLSAFFGDVADQISGQRFIYIRIACPVDVTVSYNGKSLCSKIDDLSVRTDFGSLTFEEEAHEQNDGDNRVKILRLKDNAAYDIHIDGTGKGHMNYSIGFMDKDGDYRDFRKFYNIKITKNTIIDTTAKYDSTTSLKVENDGDGKYDVTYKASANEMGKIAPRISPVTIALAATVLLIVIAAVVAIKKRRW